jgi:hypothetical protein
MEAGAGSDDPTMTEQYISISMKYTVNGSILQYKVGLTLSFLKVLILGVAVGPRRR